MNLNYYKAIVKLHIPAMILIKIVKLIIHIYRMIHVLFHLYFLHKNKKKIRRCVFYVMNLDYITYIHNKDTFDPKIKFTVSVLLQLLFVEF